MAFLTPLLLEEARDLGRAFDLRLERVEALALGSVNSNFRLVTEDGLEYFARVYEEQPLDGARTEVRLLTALSASGVPVVRPLTTRDGDAVVEFRGKPFAIFPWVQGEWLCLARVEPAHCRAVGAALAGVHAASGGLQRLPDGRFRPSDLLSRLDRVEAEGPARLMPYLVQIREKYAEYLPRRRETPLGVCHGDLFRDNVLWQKSRLAALLDFESAYHGSFAYDLMVTVLAWCYTDELVLERASALLEGYVSVRPLSDDELDVLEVEGALACLRFATTRITDFELRAGSGERPGRDFRRFLARLAALEAGALVPLRSHLKVRMSP